MKRIIFISIAAAVLIGLTVFKLLSNSQEAKNKIYIHDMEAAVLVDIDHPQQHTFESAFSYLGVFEPMHQNNISAEGSGKLIELLILKIFHNFFVRHSTNNLVGYVSGRFKMFKDESDSKTFFSVSTAINTSYNKEKSIENFLFALIVFI